MFGINSQISNPETDIPPEYWDPKSASPTRITRQTDKMASKKYLAHSKENQNIQKRIVESKKVKELRKRVLEMEKMQAMVEKRLKGYVNGLERELQKKEKQNQELKGHLTSLKSEINEGTEDVQMLVAYLSKNKSLGLENMKIQANQPTKTQPLVKIPAYGSTLKPAYYKKNHNMDYWKLKSIN